MKSKLERKVIWVCVIIFVSVLVLLEMGAGWLRLHWYGLDLPTMFFGVIVIVVGLLYLKRGIVLYSAFTRKAIGQFIIGFGALPLGIFHVAQGIKCSWATPGLRLVLFLGVFLPSWSIALYVTNGKGRNND